MWKLFYIMDGEQSCKYFDSIEDVEDFLYSNFIEYYKIY